MTAAVLAAAVVILAVTVVVQAIRHSAVLERLDEKHRDERGELLNRIQRPEWIPPRGGPRPPPRPTDAKQLAQIGSLNATSDDG